MKILLVTQSTSHAAATTTVAALAEMGHIVTSINESTLGSYTVPSDIDVIATVRATPATYGPWIAARWAEGWPVLLGGPENGVTDGATTHYGETLGVVKDALVTAAQNQGVNYAGTAHPIMNGFSPSTTYSIAGSTTYSVRDMTATPYGTVVAASSHVGTDTAIIAIEEGDAIASGTAPARLVFLGNLYGGVAYTADGKKIISQAADWAAGGQTKFITEDAYTDSTNASVNNGATTFVSATTTTRRAFLKIPAPVLQSGEVVFSAKLQLTSLAGYAAGQQLTVLSPTANWDEGTINHNNMPSATTLGVVTLPALTANVPYTIDITDCWDEPNGLAFAAVTTGVSWQSSENATIAYRPIVIYEVAPAVVGIDDGYNAEVMTANATAPNATVVAVNGNGGYAAQVSTASAFMPDPIVTTTPTKVLVNQDSYTSTVVTAANYGENAGIAVGDQAQLFAKAPITLDAGMGVGVATASLYLYSNQAARTVEVHRIDSPWTEGTITHNNRPATTLLRTVTISAAQNSWVEIDVSGLDPNYGYSLRWPTGGASGNFSFRSSEYTTDTTKVPYILYHVGPQTNVSAPAPPLTASAGMVDPVVSTNAMFSAAPMTASAVMLNPTVSILSIGEISAEAMHAQATMPQGSNFAMPVSVAAEPSTASVEMTEATAASELGAVVTAAPMRATASWRKPALVNDSPVVTPESEDKFAQLVLAQSPTAWFRLNEAGPQASDRVTPEKKATYVGVQTEMNEAPEGRHSVFFNGSAYIQQIEGGTANEVGARNNVIEFSFRTTKDNQFIMVTDDSRSALISNTTVPPREVFMRAGRIGFRTYNFGYTSVAHEFTGFKYLADGNWHRVSIVSNISDGGGNPTDYGVSIYVDGQFEVRRSAINGLQGWTGFPDYIGARPNISASMAFVGDMTEVVLSAPLTATQIARRYYAFMGWNPVVADPITAFGFMTDGNKGRGNQKRALYLYWNTTVDKYNYGGGTASNKPNYDLLFQNFRESGVFDLHDYKVFAVPVIGDYRDPVYDQPTLVDLENNLDMRDYDVILFGDWPDEGPEEDVLKQYGGIPAKERLIRQIRDANENGVGLMVTHPRLAVDLGIIDRVEYVPNLKEFYGNAFTSPDNIGFQGNATGNYDYGSAVKFPWNISADSGLGNSGLEGAAGTGVPQNMDPAYLDFKAYFYEDHNYNNKFRVRALIDGLTNIPSWMIKDAIWHTDRDIWGEQTIAMDLIDRRNGLQIGDEFIFNGTNAAETDWTDNSFQGMRLGRPYGYYAAPLPNVKAGTVVTTFGATHWLKKAEVANPYKDYATTIALDRGDVLAGRPVGGRIFVSFTESPFMLGETLPVDILPGSEWDDGTAKWPQGYKPETAAQRNWEFSTTRMTLRNTAFEGKLVETTVVMPDGSTSTVRDIGDGFVIATGKPLFNRKAVPSWDMTQRGLWWVSRGDKPQEGDKVVASTPLTATAEMPQPTVTAQKDGGYNAQPMGALAQMTRVAESTVGGTEVRMLPMTAIAEFTGFSKVISATPMTATAELVENFNMIHASGEQVVLTLHGVDTTLYLKEEA